MEPVGRKTAEMQGLLLSFFFLIHFIPQDGICKSPRVHDVIWAEQVGSDCPCILY
jgi:hypothetical protein